MKLEQMDVQIGKDLVGNSQRCFVALEPSATYRNFDEAKSMVEAVSNAGAQAIKFQTFLPGDVTVARQILVLFVGVQIPVGQPLFFC